MILPYRHRLLAHYGPSTVELARFQRPIDERDIRFWTEGVTDWSIEHTLTDRQCISSRPRTKQYQQHAPSLRMKPAEIAALEERGVQPSYVT